MKNKIKFAEVDVSSQDIKNNILSCLKNNWVTNGPKVKELEEKYKTIFGYKYVVAVNSGTTADLMAALSLYDIMAAIPRKSEVIVPALGFISAINAFWMSNLNLKFCDIKIPTLNIDESKIGDLITDNTVAILAINTMGYPCEMDKLRNICDDAGLMLISDNCEGHLCRFRSKEMKDWADIVTYSGYSAHLPFSVEMGWVGTNNEDIYNSVIANRTHGRPHGNLLFEHTSIGWNGKPTDLHASIGLSSLNNISKIFETRKEHLDYIIDNLYLRSLEKIFYISPQETSLHYPCPHALSLTFRIDNELRFQRFCGYLSGKDIEYKLNFKSIPTQQKAYTRFYNYKLGDFPCAEFVGRNGLHLPVHQFLSRDDLDYIIETIYRFFQ